MAGPCSAGATVRMLIRYKAWANASTFRAVMSLPEGEAERARPTRFGNIVHTLNHAYVIDDIFRAHLEGRPHGYEARNTPHPPPLTALWQSVQAMDRWYVAYAERLGDHSLGETVRFEFVGGEAGAMTREAILLHVVNHGTYHRGFVGDMLYQVPAALPANDLPVFLRDVFSLEEPADGEHAHRILPLRRDQLHDR
ncbi:damage-inducible protein DinB [Altererythrobacter sp. B11]|nr:damage-inducible protein DinB [Altererythrobacter sp. B11]